jgi:catecholate siderophore receptor
MVVIAAVLAANAFAAETFKGRALDASGAAVPFARVSAFHAGEDASAATATADREGHFALSLQPGDYIVRVSQKSLEVVEQVTIANGDAAIHDFVLQTSLHESITVRAPGGYVVKTITTGTKTPTALRDVPQAITVVTKQLMQDQLMTSVADVVRFVPGVSSHQGENNRDQLIMRGNSSSADFFVDGVRDDVQYYRDLYNLDRVEALKGPNAMIFGRGGAGGVFNRVTKEAGFAPLHEVSMQGGAYSNKRIAADFDEALSDRLALRLNGVYENSGSFRDNVGLKRSGIAPSLTFLASDATKVTFNVEHFRDRRVADRGISSYQGKPADVDIDTFYGNPNDSHVNALVNLASASIEHVNGAFSIRNRTLFAAYDRDYQNYVPGAVSADKSRVAITAYNNATERRNIFNQTDLNYTLRSGRIKHVLLAGAEFGRQETDNFRNTGFFNNTSASMLVPYATPTVSAPVTYRQSATDADNHLRANVAAIYAQDQIELSPRVQLLAGVRFDRFDLDFHNHRNGESFRRADNLVSPRAGIVVKPLSALSLYGSYSISYLPSSGDQFSSLTSITQQMKPEKFENREAGVKWDASDSLALTAAIYRLDRMNTRSTDPNDPTRIVQTGSQRSNGFELGVNGRITNRWSVAGGYAWQDAVVTSATAAAREGARVGQVPRHTFSLWNNVDMTSLFGVGAGIIVRSSMFAAIDNSVILPGYARVDLAAYYRVTKDLRVQVNVENALDTRYYANSDSNTNISPGSPRAVRIGFVTRF